MEQCIREDAIEIQDIRELGLGWAWFVNGLRAFLPAWQDMELASPFPEEPVTQVDADVPLEPLSLQAETADLELDLRSYERPLAVFPFAIIEHVSDWADTHAVTLYARPQSRIGKWIRTDLGVRALCRDLGRIVRLGNQWRDASHVLFTHMLLLSHWVVTCNLR